ncbi:SsgA family sporulation/cell division regulator [Streptomyces sp. NPDC060194]|uniref:SsgA family sporulation/cell division regulator n=1 Tax=Streptomyces sp. NPDC060194 TaxID=3347069 RepID=UPI00364862D4
MSTVIEQSVQARLITTHPGGPDVPVVLRYDATDPFAVRMTFPPAATLDGDAVSWVFARDLLDEGLAGEGCGAGDVRVRPYGFGRTVLEFHAEGGAAMVHVRTAELRGFLDLTVGLVPVGEEAVHLGLDRELAELLRG